MIRMLDYADREANSLYNLSPDQKTEKRNRKHRICADCSSCRVVSEKRYFRKVKGVIKP